MNELYEILRAKNVYVFAKALFDFELTETQKEIVRTIAFSEHKRVVISCMTRYGKTRCTAIGVLLYILLNKNKRILLLAPRFDQTSILRNYITEGIMNCSLMINMLDLDYENKAEHLKKEISRKRITFKNGCELIVLSAEGTAERLMGYGADCLIIDESALISYEVFRSKISRMLGDSPDSLLIEIGNPWARDNQFYEHWIDPAFKKIHVGYQTALNEGRVSPAFIQEQKQLLTPTEFQVLYESRFPDQEEDSLFKFSDVMFAVNRLLKIEKGEIPSDKVYEDDEVLAFLDISPKVPGHTLLIPKQHYPWFEDLPDELLDKVFRAAKRIAKDMKKDSSVGYVQVSVVGKDVPHAHVHLLPQKGISKASAL